MTINMKTGSMYTEDIKKVIYDCIDALEIGLNYVECSGWTRTRDKEIALIQAAIDKAREAMV